MNGIEQHESWGRELANKRVTLGIAIREWRGVSRYPSFSSLHCLSFPHFFLSFLLSLSLFLFFFACSFHSIFFCFISLVSTWAAGDTCIDDFHLILLFRCVVQAFSFLRHVSLFFCFFSSFRQLQRGRGASIHAAATICHYPVVASRLWALRWWH